MTPSPDATEDMYYCVTVEIKLKEHACRPAASKFPILGAAFALICSVALSECKDVYLINVAKHH